MSLLSEKRGLLYESTTVIIITVGCSYLMAVPTKKQTIFHRIVFLTLPIWWHGKYWKVIRFPLVPSFLILGICYWRRFVLERVDRKNMQNISNFIENFIVFIKQRCTRISMDRDPFLCLLLLAWLMSFCLLFFPFERLISGYKWFCCCCFFRGSGKGILIGLDYFVRDCFGMVGWT